MRILSEQIGKFALLLDPNVRREEEEKLSRAGQNAEERRHMLDLLADDQIRGLDSETRSAVASKLASQKVTTQELAWMQIGFPPDAHNLSSTELLKYAYRAGIRRNCNSAKYPDKQGLVWDPPEGFRGIDDKALEIAVRHWNREKGEMTKVDEEQ